MLTIIWCLFSPIILFIGTPISLFISIKNLFTSGPYVPLKQKFSPLFRLFCFGWASSTDDVYLLGSGFARFLPPAALVVHLIIAAHAFGFIYISYIPYYLEAYASLSGIPFLLAAVSLVPIAFDHDYSAQHLYFMSPEYRPYLEKLKSVSARNHISFEHESWATSISTDSLYVPVDIEHDGPENIVDCVAFIIDEDISPQQLSLLISVLLHSFDNTATSQKVYKITQTLLSNVRSGFAVVCLDYSVGFATDDRGRFALCAALNS